MPKPLSEYYAEMAAKIRADEEAERDEEAKAKLAALEEVARTGSLSEEDREILKWVRDFRAELDAEPDDEETPAPKPKDEEKPKPEDEPKPKTRPGRKKGQAYGWWVDDEGKVYKLKDGAKIWTGADEPDEVEIAEAKPEPEPKPDEAAA